MKQQGKEEMSMQNESGKLSAVMAWMPLLILVGIGVAIFINSDGGAPEANGIESVSREEFRRAQKYPSRSFQAPSEDSNTTARKSSEALFQELVSDTMFAGLRLADFETVQEIDSLNNKWIEYSIPILVQYMDATVTAESWIRDSAPRLAEMRLIADRLDLLASSLPTSTYRESIALENARLHRRGLNLLSGLHQSVGNGEVEGQDKWLAEIGTLAGEQEEFALMVLKEVKRASLLSSEVRQLLGDRADRILQAFSR